MARACWNYFKRQKWRSWNGSWSNEKIIYRSISSERKIMYTFCWILWWFRKEINGPSKGHLNGLMIKPTSVNGTLITGWRGDKELTFWSKAIQWKNNFTFWFVNNHFWSANRLPKEVHWKWFNWSCRWYIETNVVYRRFWGINVHLSTFKTSLYGFFVYNFVYIR